jgi:cellulose synthase/poly-beta-1,6-N-acetylglucosamine synthase-like glycosyltransferase
MMVFSSPKNSVLCQDWKRICNLIYCIYIVIMRKCIFTYIKGILEMHLTSVVTKILWIFSFLLAIYAAYYVLISFFALKKPKPFRQDGHKHRFAAIIAARNEAQVIGNLVQSLKEQDYPTELFEIIVIPNNCTDNTEEVAEEAGATILHCTEKVKSKGQVLAFAFDYILKKKDHFDAYCIFDADNLVEPNFLKEMNNALCSGAKVAQGYRDSKNPMDSFISSCHSIYYYCVNGLYNRARNALGLSAIITGTGFMVSADTIKQLGGWNTKTMTEDLEFSALCVLNGINIHWVPKAIVYDEQPITIKQSWDQRMRWSIGIQQCFRTYVKPLAINTVSKRSVASLDLILLFVASYMQLLGFASLILGLAMTIFNVKYKLFPQTDIFFKLFMSFDGSYLSSMIIAVVAVLLEKKSIGKMIWGILTSWFFIASWIPINIICLFRKSTDWKQIEHTRKLSLGDI